MHVILHSKKRSTNFLRISLLYKYEKIFKAILSSENNALVEVFFHKMNAFRQVCYQILDRSTEIMCFLVL